MLFYLYIYYRWYWEVIICKKANYLSMCVCVCVSSQLWNFHQCVVSFNRTSHLILKRINVWGDRQPGVSSHVVVKIFLQQFSCICGMEHLLLLVVGSFSSYSLDLTQYYFLSALDVDLRVVSEVMSEDKCNYKIAILSGQLKHHDVNWVFGFHHS